MIGEGQKERCLGFWENRDESVNCMRYFTICLALRLKKDYTEISAQDGRIIIL